MQNEIDEMWDSHQSAAHRNAKLVFIKHADITGEDDKGVIEELGQKLNINLKDYETTYDPTFKSTLTINL